MDHFKQPDPIGIPGADIPEPYPVPDMKQTISFGTTLYFKNMAVHGISKFRILYVNAEIGAMEVGIIHVYHYRAQLISTCRQRTFDVIQYIAQYICKYFRK